MEKMVLDYHSIQPNEEKGERDYVLVNWPRWEEEDRTAEYLRKFVVVLIILVVTAVITYLAMVGMDSRQFRDFMTPPQPKPVQRFVVIPVQQ